MEDMPVDMFVPDLDAALDMPDMPDIPKDLPDIPDMPDMPDMPDIPKDIPDIPDMPDLIDSRYSVEVEAEDMTLQDYDVFSDNAASGGAWVQTQGTGTATMTFKGEPGVYRIIVTYYDENDGRATMIVSLDQNVLDAWNWDDDLGSNLANVDTRTTRTIEAVTLETDDLIEFQGISDVGERARFDVVLIQPM